MPINEYDISVRPQYVSSRIDLPFGELQSIAANQQKSFNEGKALEDDLGILGQAIKAAPMHEDDRAAFINKYKTKIKDLTGNGNINYADPEFKRKMSNLINEFKSAPEINAFANTLKFYNDYQQTRKSKGNERDLDYTYERNPDGSYKQKNVLTQGVYDQKITAYADQDVAAKEAMGKMAQNGYTTESGLNLSKTKLNNGETLVYDTKTNSYVGVSDPRVKKESRLIVPNYASKDAGKYHLETILRDDFGLGDKAYNISYNQIENEANAAQQRINSGKGSEQDKQTVAMKNHIDDKMANFIYASNSHQVGAITSSTHDEHYEQDRNRVAANEGARTKEEANKLPWGVVTGTVKPGEVPTNNGNELLKAKGSAFTMDKNGNLKETVSLTDVKPKYTQTIYTHDKTGKVWNLDDLPKGWRKDPNAPMGEDQIISTGGSIINFTVDKDKNGRYLNTMINPYTKGEIKNPTPYRNKDIINQQSEILGFLKNSDQYDSKKTPIENYNAGLKLYEKAIRSGAYNTMSHPEFSAPIAKNFNDFYLPKGEVDKDGNVKITNAGNVANWETPNLKVLDGQTKDQMLVGANVLGPDLIKGGDWMKVETRDGQEISVKTNNENLKSAFKGLSKFTVDNNNAIVNPDKRKTISEQESLFGTKERPGPVSQMVNQILNDNPSATPIIQQSIQLFNQESNKLKQQHYSPVGTYVDPNTGITGVSYINRQDPDNPIIKVIKFYPGTQPEVMDNTSFNSDIYQNSIGGQAANWSSKSSEATGTTTNNQKAN